MTDRPRTVTLIVAAGSGSRAGGAVPKQYAHLAGKSLIAHAYAAFAAHPAVAEVVVVIAPGAEDLVAAALGPVRTVVGGATRRESVARGLAAIAADAPMRLDGEIVLPDGFAVNWRELHGAGPDASVLAKGLDRLELRPAAALLSALPPAA